MIFQILITLGVILVVVFLSNKKIRAVEKKLAMFQLAVEGATDHILITDAEGIILYANPGVTRITGFENKSIVGQKAGTKELWGGQMSPEFYKNMWRVIKEEGRQFIGEVQNKRKSGEKYIAMVSIAPIKELGKIRFFVAIERDITKEREIDRMKTEFISLASHQLRTPLAAMRWFSEMLLAGDLGKLNQEQTEYVNNIEGMNRRMIELVNSLLNISRIESGRMTISPRPTEIAELIEGVTEDTKDKVEEKSQTLVVDIQPELPKISLDPGLIHQVLLNLVTNASKYSPAKSKILITVSKDDKDLICDVKDSGYGIPKEEQAKIFTKFFRASNVVKNDTDGTGLGLYLTKAIVESSGGKIRFESEEGKGTTFRFSIPLEGVKPHEGEVTISQSE